MELIALMGGAGAGKDTVGHHLKSQYGHATISFADGIKDSLAAIFGWDRNMLEGATPQSRAWREQADTWWGDRLGIEDFTPRRAMTMYGSDVMRRYFHDNIWLLNTERRMSRVNGPIVICDLRFKIEIDMVRRLGGLIYRIDRGDDPVWIDTAIAAAHGEEKAVAAMTAMGIHRSEWEWRGTTPDGVLQNDNNIPALYTQVDRLIGKLPA